MRGGSTAVRLEPKALGLVEAVLFVNRASIRPLLRQELKNAGIVTIHNVENEEACAEEMARHPEALLILDWDHPPATVNAALRHAKGHFGIDTRPILLIATELSVQIISTAAEYYVSRVHGGEVSRGSIQEHLDFLVDQESNESGLRASLMRVADARRRDDWKSASQLLIEMNRRFPDDRRITCELAENFIHENKWNEASAIVDLLSATSNNNLRVQHLKARCLMKRGAFDEAAELLREARIVNPFNVDRLVDLGKAYMQIDRVKDAMHAFEDVLALEPGHIEARNGQLQCKLLDGDVNDALDLMRQMSTPRELAALFNNAAILSIRHGRFEQGMSLYHTAIGALGDTDDLVSRLFYNLGLAYHKQGKSPESLTCFERALRIDRKFDKARHNAQVVAGRLTEPVQTVDIDEENFFQRE